MFNQQLTFALIFIFLGSLLGWFSHSAYHGEMIPDANSLLLSETFQQKNTNDTSIRNTGHHLNEFSQLLLNGHYEKALQVYRTNEKNALDNSDSMDSKRGASYRFILDSEIERLHKHSQLKQLQELLNVFLEEYYNNVTLLLRQADIYAQAGQYEAAIKSYYQAKSYEFDNDARRDISQAIYDLSHTIVKQLSSKEDWSRGVKLFEQFIEYETEFAFYHVALAEFYIRLNNESKAILHLQLVANDSFYGNKASKILRRLYFNESHSGIELTKQNEHYLVQASLSELFQVQLMIDTGASLTVLSPEMILKLVQNGLATRTGSHRLYTAGGQVQADIYQVSNLSIGEFTVDNINVAELELEPTELRKQAIDGLLGMNFLKQFNFSIDQEAHELLLSPK